MLLFEAADGGVVCKLAIGFVTYILLTGKTSREEFTAKCSPMAFLRRVGGGGGGSVLALWLLSLLPPLFRRGFDL